MKKLLNLLAAAAVVLTGLYSCVKAEMDPVAENNKAAEVTLEAVLADAQATKTSVNEAGNVYWNPRDSIMVFFGDYAVPFVSYNSAPSAKALFVGTSLTLAGSNENATGDLGDYSYWSVYPMQTRKARYIPTRSAESVFAYVDAIQAGKAGTFDNSTFVTVACSKDWKQLSFYNLCGGIRFKVTGKDIDIVTFKGNNGEKLAGEVSVKMDAAGHPYPAEAYSIQPELQLRAPKGEFFQPGVWYYIVSLPAQLSKGYTMRFISSAAGKVATKTDSAAKEIKRSVFGEIADADAGLEWAEGFDLSELDDMEDAIEVTGLHYNEAEGRIELDITYHSRYIQQLVERADLDFYGETEREFNIENTEYALIMPYFSSKSDYLTRQAEFSYEEYLRLEIALEKLRMQMYLAKAEIPENGTVDPSAIKFYKIHGEKAFTLRNGEYLSSTEDRKGHYFYINYWYNSDRTLGVYALTEEDDRVAFKQAIDLSRSVLYNNNGSVYTRELRNGVFYLVGMSYNGDNLPVAEAFGFDGSYQMAQLELEAGWHTDSSMERLGSVYMIGAYNDDTYENATYIFWPGYQSEQLVFRYADIPGYRQRWEQFGDNYLVSTSYGWCLVSSTITWFKYGGISYRQWDFINEFGKTPFFAPDPSDFTVNYMLIDPYAGTVTSQFLELPEYNGDILALYKPENNVCLVEGFVNQMWTTTVINVDNGEVLGIYDENNYDAVRELRDGAREIISWNFNRNATNPDNPGDSWAVIGDFWGDGWTNDYVMEQDPTQAGVYFIKMGPLSEGNEFKFRRNQSWDQYDNFGLSDGTSLSWAADGIYEGSLANGGANIVIPESGDWVIYFSPSGGWVRLELITSSEPVNPTSGAWSVIGVLQGSNWDKDFYMDSYPNQEGVYVIKMEGLVSGSEFKFRRDGNWAVNLGAAPNEKLDIRDDGTWSCSLAQDGPNLVVPYDGNWVIYLCPGDAWVQLVRYGE